MYTISLRCPNCGDADIVAEIIVDSWGSPPVWGAPEDSYEGDPIDWHFGHISKCGSCGYKMTDDDVYKMSKNKEVSREVEEILSEPLDEPEEEPDYPNYDPDHD